MSRLFVVIHTRGPAWNDAAPLEDQTAWDAHAAFMDSLVEQGFIALGGPLDETRDALLVVRASSEAEVRERLAPDPWKKNGMLLPEVVHPWILRLGKLS